MAHIATLRVEEDSGEKNHVLQPVVVGPTGDTVKASIASIKGTESMTDDQSLEALRCGRVIARVIATGDHDPTGLKEGSNFLVVSLTQPMSTESRWVFVVLNRNKNHRASLQRFKYTPHWNYGTPATGGVAAAIRGAAPLRPLSLEATSCVARGLKACFIDGELAETPGPAGAYVGHGNSGFSRRLTFSQPWVPCPLYGCCCGGDACHGT